MKKRQTKTSRFVLLFLLFLFFIPGKAHSASDEVERLAGELKKPDWQTVFLSHASFIKYRDDKSFETLSSLISNKGINWRIRVRAILLLGGTQNPRGIELLSRTLTDPIINNDCPAIKWNTATALGNYKNDTGALEALIYVLKFESNIVVREAVIDSLGRIGNPDAVTALTPLLKDRSFAIRRSVIRALGDIGDPASALDLNRVLAEDDDPYIKNEARAVLKKLHGHG